MTPIYIKYEILQFYDDAVTINWNCRLSDCFLEISAKTKGSSRGIESRQSLSLQFHITMN
jgi:hypothetical protein